MLHSVCPFFHSFMCLPTSSSPITFATPFSSRKAHNLIYPFFANSKYVGQQSAESLHCQKPLRSTISRSVQFLLLRKHFALPQTHCNVTHPARKNMFSNQRWVVVDTVLCDHFKLVNQHDLAALLASEIHKIIIRSCLM